MVFIQVNSTIYLPIISFNAVTDKMTEYFQKLFFSRTVFANLMELNNVEELNVPRDMFYHFTVDKMGGGDCLRKMIYKYYNEATLYSETTF